MEYIITPIWLLLDFLALTLFSNSFFALRYNTKKTILILGLIWSLTSICAVFLPDDYTYRVLSYLFVLLLQYLLYRGTLFRYLLSVTIGLIFIGIIDTAFAYGICALLDISYSDFVWKKLLFTATGTMAKLVALLLSYLFAKYHRQKKIGSIQHRWMILSILFPASSLAMMMIIFVSFQETQELSLSAVIYGCVMAIANFAILYLINIMEKRTKEEQQLTLLNQQIEIQSKSIAALNQSYQNQRRATHEHLHQLQTIVDLMDRGEEQSIRQYISEIQGTRRTTALNINTHNPVLDAILNQKYQWASENGIKVQFQINDLSQITLGLNELVVLFANLFDNAIEACLKLPTDRAIFCHIICEESLYISIRNTSQPVEIVNGLIETTKEPRHEHGFGLPDIRHILNGLSAEFAYHFKDGWFHFVAEIPLKSSK